MQSIKDLEKNYGLSYWKARKRVVLISEHFGGEVKGGENSKYWLTDNGLTILQRLLELEDGGYAPAEAVRIIEEELDNDTKPEADQNEPNEKQTKPKLTPDYVDKLEDEIQFLRSQLEERDKQIQQLLPKPDQSYDKVLADKSFWQVFKEWFQQPVA